MTSNYLKLLRPEEWLQRFAIVLLGYLLVGNVSINDIYPILMAFLAYIGTGSFGFIINDYFDCEADKRKDNNRNPISKNQVSKKSAASLAVVFGIFCLFVSYFFIPQVFVLFLLSILFFILYSVPPFRFKEKLGLDILTNAFALPVFFLVGYMLFRELSFPVLLIALCLFLLDIITGIAQEIRDYKADKKAGFYTTVIGIGIRNSQYLIRIICILFIALYVATIYFYFPIFLLIPVVSLLPLLGLVFSDKLKPEMPSEMLTAVNNKCHLLLLLSIIIVVLLSSQTHMLSSM